MNVSPRAAVVLLLALAPVARPLAAQQSEAQVVPRGMVMVEAGGIFASFGERFGEPGAAGGAARAPLGTAYRARLGAADHAALDTLQRRLNRLYAAEEPEAGGGAFTASPANLFAEVSRLDIEADHRRVPFALGAGLLPRLQLSLRSSLVQHWLQPAGFGVEGGTVGPNPDPARNRALLVQLDSAYAALGGGLLLPRRGTAAGEALQSRVRAATGGQELLLPGSPVAALGVGGLAAAERLGAGRYQPGRPAWEPGDSEAALRVQLFDLLDGRAGAAAHRTGLRAAVEAGVRLPTGRLPDADYLVLPLPETGLRGYLAGAAADLLVAGRFGLDASVGWESVEAVELLHREWQPTDSFPAESRALRLRWEPGSRLRLRVAPRLQLADELALFGGYVHERRAAETYRLGDAGAEAVHAGAREARRWEAGAEFSTLPAFRAGRTRIPFDAVLRLGETFGGRGGAPAARTVEMYARLYLQAWGRARPPSPASGR